MKTLGSGLRKNHQNLLLKRQIPVNLVSIRNAGKASLLKSHIGAQTCMFEVALMHWSDGTSTDNVSDMPPERVSTIALGLMDMSGLRSFPDKKSFLNAPA